MKFVTIKESHYLQDLVVLKSRLESEGIPCRLKNELTTQVMNYIPAFMVELQVNESDLEKAKQILIETGDLQSEPSKAVCPQCGSAKIKLKLSFVKRVKLYLSMFYVLVGTNLPMDKLFKKSRFYCSDCGGEFY